MRSEATKLATRGFRVFPLAPLTPKRKAPLNAGWQQEATNDAFEVLNNWPEGAPVGIATGDDITVIDAEVIDGLETAAKWNLPETFTVETWSGGRHYYFKTPPGAAVTNSVKKIAAGIDIRGRGGLVAAPGCQIEGKRYRVIVDAPLAEFPPEIAALCRKAREREATPDDVQRDPPGSRERGEAFIAGPAPSAQAGNRDNTATAVAMRLYDFAVSRDTCRELLDVWNETKCSPPLDDEALDRIAWSAERSKQDAIGREDPTRAFDVVPLHNAFALRVRDYSGTEALEKVIPPRAWLLQGKLLRKAVTLLGAPGSAGKSLWSLQVAVALAIGKRKHGEATLAEALTGSEVVEETKVLVINNEDPDDEMDRRLAAIMTHFGIDRRAAHGKIKLVSGVEKKIKIARKPNGKVEIDASVEQITEYVRDEGIGAVIFDPFVSTHMSEENQNMEMQQIMEILTTLASETNAAVLLVHHTAKPTIAAADAYAGNVNSIRGASAIKDAARAALTMFQMSKADAEKYDIKDAIRHKFVRMDGAKPNYSEGAYEPEWFEKRSVNIGNGESMGVLVPVTLVKTDAEEAKNIAEALAPHMAEIVALKHAVEILKACPVFADYGEAAIRKKVFAAFQGGPLEIGGIAYNFIKTGDKGGTFRPA